MQVDEMNEGILISGLVNRIATCFASREDFVHSALGIASGKLGKAAQAKRLLTRLYVTSQEVAFGEERAATLLYFRQMEAHSIERERLQPSHDELNEVLGQLGGALCYQSESTTSALEQFRRDLRLHPLFGYAKRSPVLTQT